MCLKEMKQGTLCFSLSHTAPAPSVLLLSVVRTWIILHEYFLREMCPVACKQIIVTCVLVVLMLCATYSWERELFYRIFSSLDDISFPEGPPSVARSLFRFLLSFLEALVEPLDCDNLVIFLLPPIYFSLLSFAFFSWFLPFFLSFVSLLTILP